MQAKPTKSVNVELEKAIDRLLKEVMKDPNATITDKTKVIDRALKLEAIKQKMDEPDEASGFDDDD